MANEIRFRSYKGKYTFLSNFSPCLLIVDDKEYYHTEGFYQASKFIGINDEVAETIRMTESPGDAKKIARGYRLPAQKLKEWNDGLKVHVMRRAILLKFMGHYDLRNALLATGDSVLIEYAPWDGYWGSGKDGNGENMLGKILMDTRTMIRQNNINCLLL